VAVIGSANCNRRGWGFDSEVIAAIFDVEAQASAPSFAQKLRMKLWAMHLGVAESAVTHGFAPGVMDMWRELPATARVWFYLYITKTDTAAAYLRGAMWQILDPNAPTSWEFVDPSADGVASCSTDTRMR
jgi:phosphatidylserine/phosphatidylglycerophosphate/cardiolipin synthase-like enzyme